MHGGENFIHGFQGTQPVGKTGNSVSKRSLRRLGPGNYNPYELEEEEKQIGENMRNLFLERQTGKQREDECGLTPESLFRCQTQFSKDFLSRGHLLGAFKGPRK